MSVFGGTRSRLLAAVVAGVVLLSVAGVWAVAAYRGSGPPSGFRVIKVGDAAVALGNPSDGVLETRWRDTRGRWSRGQRVRVPGAGSWFHIEHDAAGSTLAAHVFFLGPIDDDTGEPSGPRREAFVACSDLRCDVEASTSEVSAADRPQLTPDGRTAYFGRSADGYLVWRRGHGLGTERVSGLAPNGGGRSQPLLAPNGSFRTVQGVRARGGCRMTLSTTGVSDTAFVESVSFRRALTASRPTCASSLDSVRSDSLTVSTVRSAKPVFLALRGGAWTRVAADPSGLVHLVRQGRTLRGFSTHTGPWRGRELVVASPDARRITVQLREKGATTWTPPRTIAKVPRGDECWDIAATPNVRDDPFYATVRCRSRPDPSSEPVYRYVTALSDDGVTWTSVQGTDLPLLVGDDLLLRGRPSYRWTPVSGLSRVPLPVPGGAVVTLLEDGTYARSRLLRVSGGCTLEVRLADPDATTWSPPLPSTAALISPARCASFSVQGEGRTIYHYLERTRGRPNPGPGVVTLMWRDGKPVVESRRF